MNSETITEILNNLFVDKRNKKSQSKSKQLSKIESESKSESSKESKSQSKSESKESKSESENVTVKQNYKNVSESVKQKSVKEKSEKQKTTKNDSESENQNSEKQKLDSESEKQKTTKLESESEKEKSEKEKLDSESENQNIGNRLGISNDDIITRNMLVVSYRFESVINILSIILEKIFDVELFDDTINVLTFSENEKYFKQMLINNPNINFDFKFRETKHLNNNKIIIIDNEYIDNIDKYLDSEALIIVTSTRYQVDIAELYKKMRDYNSTLLINKIDDLELLQKKLFKRIIKNNLENEIEQDSFLESTKNHDYLFIKSGELFFS